MRRQGGHYGGDSGGGGGAQMQQNNSKSGYYNQEQQQAVSEKEERHHHHQQQQHNQWRWERDASQPKLPQTAMSPTPPFAQGQGREAPRSYYQSQRPDPRMPLEKHGSANPQNQPHEEDMDIGYEDNPLPQTFESLEQRFLDDIMKLSKEQTDAEDAENARHREKINTINSQYEEQLIALRARHASRREEFLRRESQARQQQYHQVTMEQYPSSSISPNDHRGYSAGTLPSGEPQRAYSSDNYDSYRERNRFPGNVRDHGYESRVPYPRGRAYDTGSRYY